MTALEDLAAPRSRSVRLVDRVARGLAARFTPERRRRCAVVAPSDVAFGLSRMIEVFARAYGVI